MGLPTFYPEPITGFDTRRLRELNWDWICWLKAIRHKQEAGHFTPDTELLSNAIDYFSAFQRMDGCLNLSDSYKMPSDARVDFIYIPTTVACAVVNLLAPSGGDPAATRFLMKTLPATAGREFQGSGYHANRYMAFTIELFAWGSLLPELIEGNLTSPEFKSKLFKSYRAFTEQLLEPSREHSWGDMHAAWAIYCLKLMNCSGSNWNLLKSSPLSNDFNLMFEYKDLNTVMSERFKNE